MSDGKFRNLLDMVQKSVANFPNNQLFGVKKSKEGPYEWTTYGQFGQMMEDVRGALAHRGVKEGDHVAAILDNSPAWAAACYACYGLGAIYVPMYEKQNPSDWEYILRDSGATAVVVGSPDIALVLLKRREAFPHVKTIAVVRGSAPEEASCFDWETFRKLGRDNPRSPIPVDDVDRVAGLIYTSGTTGNPKGVILTHQNFTSNINAVHELFPFSEQDVSLSFLPWAHSFGQTCELHCMLSMGASMGLAWGVETIVDNLSEVKPTLLFSVPRIWNRIYDGLQKKIASETPAKRKLMLAAIANAGEIKQRKAEGRGAGFAGILAPVYEKLVLSKIKARLGGRLKFAFSGGAALSKEVATFIDNLGVVVYEGYGLSETSPIATANRPGAQRIGSVGKPITDVKIIIDRTVEGADGDNGEILIAGPNIMKGYHNLPEESAKVLDENHVFRSGDLGRVDSDGYLWITGRVKELYKLENGKYVAPAPIEEQIKLSPFVNQIMIHGQNMPYNVAVVVPDAAEIKEWASKNGAEGADLATLCNNPQLKARVREELEKYSVEFKGYEKVENFILVPEEFTTDNDMMTPSLKVKRRNVMKKYGDALAALYNKG